MALGLVVGARTTVAEPASQRAVKLFQRGRWLMEQGKILEACAAFEGSQEAEPAIGTLINLAWCREQNGQLATAWRLFMEAESATRGASDRKKRKWHTSAFNGVTRIEPRLSKLTITVPDEKLVDALTLQRGAEAAETVERAGWNRAFPVDGGSYRIIARSTDAARWTTEVSVGGQSDNKVVIVSIPGPGKPPTTSGVVPSSTPTPMSPRVPPVVSPPPPSPSKLVPVVVTGAGGLLLAGAFGFHKWGDSTYQAAQAEQVLQARRDQLENDANARRHVAMAMGVAGGLGLVCGITWLYIRRSDTEKHATGSTRARIVPMIGGDRGISLAISGGF